MDARQQHNKAVSADEWYTPRWIIDELGRANDDIITEQIVRQCVKERRTDL